MEKSWLLQKIVYFQKFHKPGAIQSLSTFNSDAKMLSFQAVVKAFLRDSDQGKFRLLDVC